MFQKFRITNKGASPRGIHDARKRLVTIARGETREVELNEEQAARYQAKIAGGDRLEMVKPLGSAPAPEFPARRAKAPEGAPAPAPAKGGKKRGRRSKAEKEAEAAAAAQNGEGKAPASAEVGDPELAALRAEAAKLGIPDADKLGKRRLRRDIEARKQG